MNDRTSERRLRHLAEQIRSITQRLNATALDLEEWLRTLHEVASELETGLDIEPEPQRRPLASRRGPFEDYVPEQEQGAQAPTAMQTGVLAGPKQGTE